VPTANQPFKLSDGAVLNLTTAFEADRTGKQYDNKIPPDTEIKTNWLLYGTPEDPVIKAALIWLKSQQQ
jgi:C-terminal processing protease CtpA/Prc